MWSVRSYSAAAGLKKEEVEGRILGILQGFDKVNDTSNVRTTLCGTSPWSLIVRSVSMELKDDFMGNGLHIRV